MTYLEYLESVLSLDITEEINFNYTGGTVCVLKYLTGTNYRESTVQNIQLAVYTDDLPTAKTLMDNFSKAYTNVAFWEDFTYIQQFYSTPTVLQNLQPYGNNFMHQIIVSGLLIKSDNIADIQTLTIDGYEYETTERIITYTGSPDTQRKGADNIAKTEIRSVIESIQLSMINKNNDFCSKLRRMRQGTLAKNTSFTIVMTFSDNEETETYTVRVGSQTLTSTNVGLPLLQVTFLV